LVRPELDPATNQTADYWLAGSNDSFVDPVVVPMEVYGSTWAFYAMPEEGWVPGWRKPLMAAVVLVSGRDLARENKRPCESHYVSSRTIVSTLIYPKYISILNVGDLRQARASRRCQFSPQRCCC
jgi:hypothetical protein